MKYFNEDRVVCMYPTSKFLGHTCAEDLKKEFEEGIQQLDMKKWLKSPWMDPLLIGNSMTA